MQSDVFAKYKKRPQVVTQQPDEPAAEQRDSAAVAGAAEEHNDAMHEDVWAEVGGSAHEGSIVAIDHRGPPVSTAGHTRDIVEPQASDGLSHASPTALYSPIHSREASIANHNRLAERRPVVADEAMLDVADWDTLNAEEERRRVASSTSSRRSTEPISFKEAFLAIQSKKSAWSPFVTPELKRISDHVETSGFWGLWWSCLHNSISEGSEDFEDRDFVLALQYVPLDANDEVHRRMMVTIYRRLERMSRNAPDPPPFGQHWERLGFQGNDPATDLRSTGILGVLQVLYLIDFFPTFCGALYQAATNPLTEFPFVLVAFNFSGVAMEALKERGLHDDISKRRKKISAAAKHDKTISEQAFSSHFEYRPPPVMHALCELYVGSLFAFFLEWRSSVTRSVTDFGPVKAKLRPYVRNHVAKVISNTQTAGDRKKVNEITSNKTAVQYSTAGSSTAAKNQKDEREFMEF